VGRHGCGWIYIANLRAVAHLELIKGEENMRLQGKTAIVTGAGSGFGAGIAQKFAAEGATVMVADINLDAAQSIAEPLDATAQHVDVSRDSSVGDMIATAQALWGRIDILVNNAGITHLPQAMDQVSEAEFDQVFAVNAKSVYLTARHLVPLLKTPKVWRHLEYCFNRRRIAQTEFKLVQCLKRLDDYRHQSYGR